jgi:sugar lactone lactonase YvrE
MHRTAFAAAVALLAVGSAPAQDMPLSQILVEGEGWKESEGFPPKRQERESTGTAVLLSTRLPLGGRVFGVTHGPQNMPSAWVLSPDGTTMFVGMRQGTAVWAYQIGSKDKLINGAPYCQLRISPTEGAVEVLGLALDTAGRVYAATPDGIQVFDPTGRLSGVLLLPAKGRPERIAWDGEKRDRLAVWIDATSKYVRKLNTTGVK